MNPTRTATTSPQTAVARMAEIRARREAAARPVRNEIQVRDERAHRYHSSNAVGR